MMQPMPRTELPLWANIVLLVLAIVALIWPLCASRADKKRTKSK